MLCKNNGRNRSPPTMKETFQDILSVSLITRNILKHPEYLILLCCNVKYSTCRIIHLIVVMSHVVNIFTFSCSLHSWNHGPHHSDEICNITIYFPQTNPNIAKLFEKKKLKTRALTEFRNLEIYLCIIL